MTMVTGDNGGDGRGTNLARCIYLTRPSQPATVDSIGDDARKGPRAEGKVDTTGKGNPISGKGTRECRCDQARRGGSLARSPHREAAGCLRHTGADLTS